MVAKICIIIFFFIMFIPIKSEKTYRKQQCDGVENMPQTIYNGVRRFISKLFYNFVFVWFTKKCMHFDLYDIRKPIILRAMLMNFRGDRIIQSKAWLSKGRGYFARKRHNIFANEEGILGEGGMHLYEHNKKYVRYVPPRRTTQSLLEVVANWR